MPMTSSAAQHYRNIFQSRTPEETKQRLAYAVDKMFTKLPR